MSLREHQYENHCQQTVHLNGGRFRDCMFDECVLILERDGAPSDVQGCCMVNCTYKGNGWPLSVVVLPQRNRVVWETDRPA